ncbi:MAG: glycosyltransferase [Planctomycetota bacterium]
MTTADWFLLLGCLGAFVFSSMPALMFLVNLPQFRDLACHDDPGRGASPSTEQAAVSVLIPARDEEAGIERSVRAALASKDVDLEVVVMDDHSTDQTADIIREIAREDPRVRLKQGATLPATWNGKQHACFQLAKAARYDLLLFLDADVRLEPHAIATLVKRKERPLAGGHIALLSAFPRQETKTLLEKLLIPMMHYLLLSYLPFARMRSFRSPAYAAGCGQLFLTDRASYEAAGSHAAIRSSRHDGLKLPMTFRRAGLMSDCVDGSDLAVCRMYTSASEVIRGLLKNATEGIANKRLILPFTILLAGGSLLPWALLWMSLNRHHGNPSTLHLVCMILMATAVLLSFIPRLIAAQRLQQSYLGVLCHPLAVILFLIVQYRAMWDAARGHQTPWRGRVETC